MNTLKQSQEKAREKLTKKYDVRYFDGSTYAVGEEFQKDVNQIIKQVYEDVVHEVEKEVTEMKGVYSAHDVKEKVLDLLNKLKS